MTIEKLYAISKKPSHRIIGLMSGTSLDGLHIAVCNLSGFGRDTQIDLEHFATINYSDDQRSMIKKVFAKPEGRLEDVCILNAWIGKMHGGMVSDFLKEKRIPKEEIDLIASHGQTVFHAPAAAGFDLNSTLQLGDGDHIAVETGIITISDFRQKDVAKGGEGAPLAIYGDEIIFSKDRPVVLLNIGGISNYTFLDKEGKSITTDCGPGNALMDIFSRDVFQMNCDEDGKIAAKGNVSYPLLNALLDHPFFKLPFPKSTGIELFNRTFLDDALKKAGTRMSNEEIMATLNAFTAEAISMAIKATGAHGNLFISGGGIHNKTLVESIQNLPGVHARNIEEKRITADAKEAVLFALLANEMLGGGLTLGKISFP